MKPTATACLALLLFAGTSTAALSAAPAAEVLQGTTARAGLLPVHVDRKDGRILLSLPAPDEDGISGRYLYVTALKTGLGSAVAGLDRALSGGVNSSLMRNGRISSRAFAFNSGVKSIRSAALKPCLS